MKSLLSLDGELIKGGECGTGAVSPSEWMIWADAQGHPQAGPAAAKWQLCLTSRSFESPKSLDASEA